MPLVMNKDVEKITRDIARKLLGRDADSIPARSLSGHWYVHKVGRSYYRRPVPCVCNLERRINGSPCPYCS